MEGAVIGSQLWDMEAFCAGVHVRLVGQLSLLVSDVDVAEELAQDVLVEVCRHWTEIRDPEAWTYRVAVNRANSWWRRRYAGARALARHRSQQVEPAVVDSETAAIVRRAVAELPRRQRTALVLRYYVGFDIAETAAAMGCARGTVRALTHQAMTTLRAREDLAFHRRELPHA